MAGALHVTSPAIGDPLGVITGLVIAFLAARVWANVDHGQAYVAQEASWIRQAMLISSVLPPDTRDAVRREVGVYLRFVDEVDGPAMLRSQERVLRLPPGLPDALITLLSFVPQQTGQQLAQSRAGCRDLASAAGQAGPHSPEWGGYLTTAVGCYRRALRFDPAHNRHRACRPAQDHC